MKKIFTLIFLAVALVLTAGCVQKYEERTPALKELKLSDFPEVFKENTLIFVGNNASEIEVQAAKEIAEYLKNKTGNRPLIKKYSEVTEEDKKKYNLIVVGIPKSNEMLKEIYAVADVLQVNETFPGEGKGILEIARNPWNEERAMLLVEGGENKGLLFSYDEALKIIEWKEKYRKSDGEEKTFVGTIDLGATFGSSWLPRLDECSSPLVMDISGKKYYLSNICPYVHIINGSLNSNRVIVGETERVFPYLFENVELPVKVKVHGKLKVIKVKIPLVKKLNAPTKEMEINVITVLDLEVVS